MHPICDYNKMIGNAVPVNLGRYVAMAIKQYVEANGI